MALCPHCMRHTAENPCACCGKDIRYQALPHILPAGTRLVASSGRVYQLGVSIGQGGFGITYIALDLYNDAKVAIKECYPNRCVYRDQDGTVLPRPGQEKLMQGALRSFLEEARMLASLRNMHAVVRGLDYFEANNTAYLVMEYLDGEPLHRYVAQHGAFPLDAFMNKLPQLLYDVSQLHQRNIVHRDIAPDNIMLMPDGSLKLLDFGCAKSVEDGKSMSVQVKPGFAPVEQYLSSGQGAWTDVYAMAATIYYCLTAKLPASSVDRLENDRLIPPSAFGIPLSEAQEAALLWGLAVQKNDRPLNMTLFGKQFFPDSPLWRSGEKPVNPFDDPEEPKRPKKVIPTPPPAPIPTPIPKPDFIPDSDADDPHLKESPSDVSIDPTEPVPTTIPGKPVNLNTDQKKDPVPKTRFADWFRPILDLPGKSKLALGAASCMLILGLALILSVTGTFDRKTPSYEAQDSAVETVTTPNQTTQTPPPVKEEPKPDPEPEQEPEPEPEPDPGPFQTEDGYLYEHTDEGITILGYDGDTDFLQIPATIDGKPVTVIAKEAFAGMESLEYFVIYSESCEIEAKAFANCPKLQGFRLPVIPHTIAFDAFDGCDVLQYCVIHGTPADQTLPQMLSHLYPIYLDKTFDTDYWISTECDTDGYEFRLTDAYVGPSGELYGINDDDYAVLLRVPADVTDLTLVDEIGGYQVLFMDPNALKYADALESLTVPDEFWIPGDDMKLYQDLTEIHFSGFRPNTVFTCYLLTAVLAERLNDAYGKQLIDVGELGEFPELSLVRARELAEYYNGTTRPNGSEWSTIFTDYGFDYSYILQRGYLIPTDGSFTEALDYMVEELSQPADEDGKLFYDMIGLAMVEYDGKLLFISLDMIQ